MPNRPFPHAAAATLLAGVAVFSLVAAVALHGGRRERAPRSAAETQALERCIWNVNIVHDVYWAAACALHAQEGPAAFAPDAMDDSVDCTLPNERAAVLNAARAAEEAQCTAQGWDR